MNAEMDCYHAAKDYALRCSLLDVNLEQDPDMSTAPVRLRQIALVVKDIEKAEHLLVSTAFLSRDRYAHQARLAFLARK